MNWIEHLFRLASWKRQVSFTTLGRHIFRRSPEIADENKKHSTSEGDNYDSWKRSYSSGMLDKRMNLLPAAIGKTPANARTQRRRQSLISYCRKNRPYGPGQHVLDIGLAGWGSFRKVRGGKKYGAGRVTGPSPSPRNKRALGRESLQRTFRWNSGYRIIATFTACSIISSPSAWVSKHVGISGTIRNSCISSRPPETMGGLFPFHTISARLFRPEWSNAWFGQNIYSRMAWFRSIAQNRKHH